MSVQFSRRAGRIVPRQVGDTNWHDPSPHAQHWRAANEDYEGPLDAARGVFNGLLICGAIWALLAVCAWALSMLWAA